MAGRRLSSRKSPARLVCALSNAASSASCAPSGRSRRQCCTGATLLGVELAG
ncbi:hypothetical protein CC85DRAFT_287830, partial [Cutaneotrichosporon oleaginosum]